ncbi:MAG TPA: DUF2339 domain-containing protein [Acidobacteriota bacterium]|jgi:hypothetical protein|nr:DUF2339 domain-containing protein [Acidobacteriota bacterium]
MTEPAQDAWRKLEELEARLLQLQSELSELRRNLASSLPSAPQTTAPISQPPPFVTAAAHSPEVPPAPVPVSPVAHRPTAETAGSHVAGPAMGSPDQMKPAAGSAAPPEPDGASLEMKLGRQVFDKIALVALLFGVAFLLKYAFDNGWISDSVKIFAGTLTGYVLLVWSELLFQKPMRQYASIIAASGFGVLFLTVYAGLYLYGIFTPLLAFAYLLVAAFALVLQAVRHESEVLAVWSLVGAGFAPQILSGLQWDTLLTSRVPAGPLTADYQPFTLQGPYLIAINLGYSWVVFRKTWPLARLALLAVNVITVSNWNVDLAYSRPMSILLWLLAIMFVAPSSGAQTGFTGRGSGAQESPAAIRAPTRSYLATLNIVTTVLALIFFYFRLSYINNQVQTTQDYWITFGFLLLSAVGAFVHRMFAHRGEYLALISFTVLFVYIFCAQAWTDWKLALGWMLLAGALNRLATKQLQGKISDVTAAAAWIVFLSALIYSIFWNVTRPAEIGLLRALLWNRKAAMLLIIACGGIFWTVRFKEIALKGQSGVGKVQGVESARQFSLLYLAPTVLLGWYWVSQIVGEFFRHRAHYYFSSATSATVDLSTSVAWSLYAATLFAVSVIRRNAALRKMCLGLLLVTIFKVFLYDVSNLKLIYRCISFLVLSVVLYAVSYVYNRYGRRW